MYTNFKTDKVWYDSRRDVVYMKGSFILPLLNAQFEFHFEETNDPYSPAVGFIVYDNMGNPIQTFCPFGTKVASTAMALREFYNKHEVAGNASTLLDALKATAIDYRNSFEKKTCIELSLPADIEVKITYRDQVVQDLLEEYYTTECESDIGWYIFKKLNPIICIDKPSCNFRAQIDGEKQSNWQSVARSLIRYLDAPKCLRWEFEVINAISNRFDVITLPKTIVASLKELNATASQMKRLAKDIEEYAKSLR